MPDDPRLLSNGLEIPTATYSDQPYVVQTDDGAWLCCVTTGAGHEGQPGQHVVCRRSTDRGQSWGEPIPLEPADGPEASYAVMLKVPSGRVYIFYNYNADNMREVIADDPPFAGGRCSRVDSLGQYVFRYSDDHGQTWSADRYPVPMRLFAIDRGNPYGGEVRFGWNVGKPFILDGAAYLSFHKVGGFGHGFFTSSQGVLIRCAEMVSHSDPADFRYETLPDGDIGLRTPPGGGPVSEEHSYVTLSDGAIWCVYRTIDGYPTTTISRDGGHSWSEPRYLTYADGRRVKHPRAANFAWKTRDGRFLYWQHNHGGAGYDDRNPAWLCAGVEIDTPAGRDIAWSQPDILLYDDDPYIRISYPDLIETADGAFYVTETQKDIARLHRIEPAILNDLWSQHPGQPEAVTTLPEPIVQWQGDGAGSVTAPHLATFTERDPRRYDMGGRRTRIGYTLDLSFTLDSLEPGQVLLHNHLPGSRQGLMLATIPGGAVELRLQDEQTVNSWASDPGGIRAGEPQRLSIVIDSGPCLILVIQNGRLHDGGSDRKFGWGRFSQDLRGFNAGDSWQIGQTPGCRVSRFALYGQALRVSQLVHSHGA